MAVKGLKVNSLNMSDDVPGLVLLNTTSFSAVASASLPASTFSATYNNYKIIFNGSGSTAMYLQGRGRISGSDDTTANYLSGWFYLQTNGGATGQDNAGAGTSSFQRLGYVNGANVFNLTFELQNPYKASVKCLYGQAQRPDGAMHINGGFFYDATKLWDSFTFIASTGTISGKVSVYGFNE
jgi:hypothetical protein